MAMFCKHEPKRTQEVGVQFRTVVADGRLTDKDGVAFVSIGVQALFCHAYMSTCAKCNRVIEKPTRNEVGIGFQVYKIPFKALPVVIENGQMDIAKAAARWLRYWSDRGDLTVSGASDAMIHHITEELHGEIEFFSKEQLIDTARKEMHELPSDHEISIPETIKFINAE